MVDRVLLLRHGETALNRSGALRGQLEIPLSENGIREAQGLARRVHEYRPSAIVSSPRLRARATANEVAKVSGLGVQIDDRFADLDYGPWAGRTPETFSAEEQAEFRRWQRNPQQPLPGAEDPAAAQRRAIAGLNDRAAAGWHVHLLNSTWHLG